MKIKLLSDTAKVPTQGTTGSAGFDLYADEAVDIMPYQTTKIPTNIALEIPLGFFGALFARSGLATNRGLRPANCVGVIDSDYRGNILVAMHNDSSTVQSIQKGDKIAQIVFLPVYSTEFEIVNELNDTERGAGGFNSTGTK